MTNKKIVLASITVIVAAGLLALSPSMMIGNAQAQMYDSQYGYDNSYDSQYGYDNSYNNYYPEPKKSTHTDIQKIKCVNSNLNVNGIDITQIPQDGPGVAAANEEEGPGGANTQNGNGLGDRINVERNLVNICVNVNDNEQVKVTPPDLEEPEPVTCEDCFSVLNSTQINRLLAITETSSIGALCISLAETPDGDLETQGIIDDLEQVPNITPQQVGNIIECLIDSGVIDPPTSESGFICNDGIDNDRDGDIDDDDSDCQP